MEPLYSIALTADQWRSIFNAVCARADSIPEARQLLDEIEATLEAQGVSVWSRDDA